jgi:hypothetical protein
MRAVEKVGLDGRNRPIADLRDQFGTGGLRRKPLIGATEALRLVIQGPNSKPLPFDADLDLKRRTHSLKVTTRAMKLRTTGDVSPRLWARAIRAVGASPAIGR